MSLASTRRGSSHNRKLAAVLALLVPTTAWAEEVANRLRNPAATDQTLRPATAAVRSTSPAPTDRPATLAPTLRPSALNAPASGPSGAAAPVLSATEDLMLSPPALSQPAPRPPAPRPPAPRPPALIAAPPDAAAGGAGGNQQTLLIPLPSDLDGPGAVAMPMLGRLVGPLGQPVRALQDPLATADTWLPRASSIKESSTAVGSAGAAAAALQPLAAPAPTQLHGPVHSAFQILPSQFSDPDAAAPANDAQQPLAATVAAGGEEIIEDQVAPQTGRDDLAGTQAVTDPEQNEPNSVDAPQGQENGLTDSAIVIEMPESLETSGEDDDREIQMRRLSPRISARAVASRSGKRVTIGDISPEDQQETDAAQPPPRPTAVNPIHGDRITAAGELILASGRSASGLPVMPQTAPLKATIERTLRYYWESPEDAAERTHWGMMHSIMVFDKDTQIINRRQRYNAVAWMAGNNPCRNQQLFTQDQQGIVVRTGVGLQGHQAQLLAVFGLINVPLHYPVYAGRQKYLVSDVLEREMFDCKSGNELTFTLIALAHYADSDSAWVAGDQEDWDVQRVIREELSQPIVGAACGGTHRLMGFAHALRRRRAEGKPIVDQWDRADRYLAEFVDYTWTLQNRDGSMSTAWFERSDDNANMDRKIQTTGHMLEFLLTTVPDSELQSPKMIRTVSYLAGTLYGERGHQWQVGPKGHALRALAMYHQRVFGDSAPWRSRSSEQSAAAPQGTQRGIR